MNLIIAGTRTFKDYELMRFELSKFLARLKDPFPKIISGGAPGADTLAIQYAKERVLEYEIFEAQWSRYGVMAGPIRNKEMAKVSQACIIFWDGNSPGSSNMKKLAIEFNLILKIVNYLP